MTTDHKSELGAAEATSHIESQNLASSSSPEAVESQEEISSSSEETIELLKKLYKYCEASKLESSLDLEIPFESLSISFPNGRKKRTVIVSSTEAAQFLLEQPLDEIHFLGTYSAICSYKNHWIEASLRALGLQGRMGLRYRLFGARARNETQIELRLPRPRGTELVLTEKPGLLYHLDFGGYLYLRIENIRENRHDQTVEILEDISNSLLMQLDFRFNVPLTLGRDRAPRRPTRAKGNSDEDMQIAPPQFIYEKSPSALYWYGRSASSMPLLQFLAFYQCLEFSFPRYSRKQTIERVRNLLKDPTFSNSSDASINTLLNVTGSGNRGLEERKQLLATLTHCVEPQALRDFFQENEERVKFYNSGYQEVSTKKIETNKNELINDTVERIYDIRCKIVHTKDKDDGISMEMILPFSKEADLLQDDVDLVKFLAKKVLIASSSPFSLD